MQLKLLNYWVKILEVVAQPPPLLRGWTGGTGIQG